MIPSTVALVLGASAGWSVRAGIDRRDETAALNALITDLHLKRPLAAIEPRVVDGADDAQRCRATVLDARDRIIETLAHLRSNSANTDVLMRMASACTRYLRESARAPERHQFALMDLRETMVDGVKLLSDARRRVRYRNPGERSTPKPGRTPSRRPSIGRYL
ncbi:hypothetical protein QNO08_03215 [Arthrobacter sp. zg-Y820]|uniref:hypothetical protein n=1 Tax=Arthrobacter sp. zg-Y820 TaxID=2894192 RepID=UPI0024DF53EC|nr:hypothetical protein [Arthrobacter sp. zg-Y820]WIB10087.1 hypothetical protein QNO08_03215 [Arthrobacter sp. zg-Y820]